MRLLNVHNLEFESFYQHVPPYIITSHRWDAKTEAELGDIMRRENTERRGYRKVLGFAAYIRVNFPGIDWMWIDTCCIDQKSSQEVSEAVTSMFKYYVDAELCLAYLWDVVDARDIESFRRSEWFRRGWTLQELIAPRRVVFLTELWRVIGKKVGTGLFDGRIILPAGADVKGLISAITGIPHEVLEDYRRCQHIPIDERLAWMRNRQTMKEEDESYCLFGIFDVTMGVRYGEGRRKARDRLIRNIIKAARGSDSTSSSDGSGATPRDRLYDSVSPPSSGYQEYSELHAHVHGEPEDQTSPTPDPIPPSTQVTLQEAAHPDPYTVLLWPSTGENVYQYYLRGDGLEQYVVRREIKSVAGPDADIAVAPGSNGYLVKGALPTAESLLHLRRLSQEYARNRRTDQHLIGPTGPASR